MNNERNIILRAKKGDSSAFSYLMQKYEKGLEIYVSNLLSEISTGYNALEQAEEPKDICQEAFHRAFNNIESFNLDYEFSTWLFNIAKNITIDYARKRKLPITSKDNDDIHSTNINIGGGVKNSPEDLLITNQEYGRLIEIIEGLDEKYKEVAKLRFIKEYAYDEIAAETGLEINTVRTRIRRAKEQLWAIINKNK